MSIKNKALDRDYRGRIDRKYTCNAGTMTTPGWWTALYMNRPKRRQNRILCRHILRGTDPDELVFPLGNHKPHLYYW